MKPPKAQFDNPPQVAAFNGALELNGDEGGGIIIAGDLHAPATDWDMAARVAGIGRKYLRKPRRLILAGDLLNADAYSPFTALLPPPSFEVERQAAQYAIGQWLEVFDEIDIIPGNHDFRFFKLFEGAFSEGGLIDIFRALLTGDKRVRYSLYPYLTVNCARTGKWRICHPAEYGQILLSKARKLATRYQSHLILPHQHYAAMGIHENGNYAVVDLPALADYEKLAYVQLSSKSNPSMQCGFGAILNGAFHLFTKNEALTDWSRWL